jgi:hypothetical protein
VIRINVARTIRFLNQNRAAARSKSFFNSIGQGLPPRRCWRHDRCTPDSRRLAVTPNSAESGQKPPLALQKWNVPSKRLH